MFRTSCPSSRWYVLPCSQLFHIQTRLLLQVWETPFSVTDPTFPCSVDRIAGPLATTDHMYMINHSLNINLFDSGVIISDPEDANTTNSVAS